MPKVSIVGAYYNRESWVEKSISSVLGQTFTDFEFVVVNDGSTDATAEKLDAFDDPRMRVIHQANTGFRAAITRAIHESSGQYISIHASGEIFRPRLLEREVAVLDANPEIGCVAVHFEKTGSTSTFGQRFTNDQFKNIASLLLSTNPISNGGSMYRRELYEAVGGYRSPFTYTEDFDFWLRLSEITQFHLVEEVLFERVSIPGGVSTSPEKLVWQAYLLDLALWSAANRRAGAPDPVTTFGDLSIALRPPSPALGKTLVLYGLSALDNGDFAWGNQLLRLSLAERPALRFRLASSLALHLGQQPGVRRLIRLGLRPSRVVKRVIRRMIGFLRKQPD